MSRPDLPVETLPLDHVMSRAGPIDVVVLDGPDRGLRRRVGAEPCRIGSGAETELALTDPTVSRVHVTLRRVDGGVEVVDHGSKNGTLHLGQRLERALLSAGAILQLGRTTIALEPSADNGESGTGIAAASARTRYGALVGQSLPMRRLFATLEPIESCTLSVLIEGETGTGKELVAREIHAHSPRARGPFVVLDAAATARTLFESALFGHKRGAFTDAVQDRPGAAVAADGGTLFLDELGELDASLQPKLLRFLETQEVLPLGAETPRRVDVRVLAATNRDLEAEVQAGRFRLDLFHRLAVLRVRVPPLRERVEDLPLLVDELERSLRRHVPGGHVAPALLERLARYAWPGNVRELRNVVGRALSLGTEAVDAWPGGGQQAEAAAAPASLDGDSLPPFHEARASILESFERDYLARLLEECDGNVSEAARRAGLHRNYVARLKAKHGLGD